MEDEKKEPADEKKEPVKVMMADENKADQENFKEAIHDAHIDADVTITTTGQQLMDNLNDVSIPNPDIIFMDGNLELKNGDNCLEEIKKDEVLKDIPAVVYAESVETKDVDKSFNAGADLYVQKPIFFRNLVRLLHKIFSMSWQRFLSKPLRKTFVISEESVSEHTPAKPNTVRTTPESRPRVNS